MSGRFYGEPELSAAVGVGSHANSNTLSSTLDWSGKTEWNLRRETLRTVHELVSPSQSCPVHCSLLLSQFPGAICGPVASWISVGSRL